MAWLPDGEKISKISLFVLAQLTNVTDRLTNRQTGGQTPHAGNSRAMHSIARQERIEYKLLSLTYKISTTSQATYLHNLVSLQSPRGTRSSSIDTLSRPESRNARNLVS